MAFPVHALLEPDRITATDSATPDDGGINADTRHRL